MSKISHLHTNKMHFSDRTAKHEFFSPFSQSHRSILYLIDHFFCVHLCHVFIIYYLVSLLLCVHKIEEKHAENVSLFQNKIKYVRLASETYLFVVI